MHLALEERPYNGKSFRPRPEIHLDTRANLLIVATPWGNRTAARKVIDRMVDYLALAMEDREATSPFQRLTSLSRQANNLRIATLMANEGLYREDNKIEYKAGVELFACALDGQELVFLQAGNPQVLLARDQQTLRPLGAQIDLSFDLSHEDELMPPLPSLLVGLEPHLNFNINSFRARAGDRVVLLSHSLLPSGLLLSKGVETSVDSLTRTLANTYPDLAFWLGVLTIGDENI